MKILICDDNPKDVLSIRNLIDTFFLEKPIPYEIEECDQAMYLLDHINEYDLVFLDMEINGVSGIQIGSQIRKHNVDTRIIIVSNYAKYLIDGYKIHADRYFLKPVKQEEFNIEFENVMNRYLKEYEGFIDERIGKHKIYFKDILYIEFAERKSHIHLLNSQIIDTPYTLKYWEEKFEQQTFAKPHKAFLINLRYVSAIMKQDILLNTKTIIPLSRHFKHDFNEAYLDYLQGGL